MDESHLSADSKSVTLKDTHIQSESAGKSQSGGTKQVGPVGVETEKMWQDATENKPRPSWPLTGPLKHECLHEKIDDTINVGAAHMRSHKDRSATSEEESETSSCSNRKSNESETETQTNKSAEFDKDAGEKCFDIDSNALQHQTATNNFFLTFDLH